MVQRDLSEVSGIIGAGCDKDFQKGIFQVLQIGSGSRDFEYILIEIERMQNFEDDKRMLWRFNFTIFESIFLVDI